VKASLVASCNKDIGGTFYLILFGYGVFVVKLLPVCLYGGGTSQPYISEHVALNLNSHSESNITSLTLMRIHHVTQ
jgi:hypothetical protein